MDTAIEKMKKQLKCKEKRISMKSKILFFSAVIICLFFSACKKECVHEFESQVTMDANCISEGVRTDTCKLCEYSCTEPVPTTDHFYDNGVITVPASCAEQGIRTYTCTVCNDTKTEQISKLEHEFDEGVETRAPSCAASGILTYTCNSCGETKSEEIGKLEHTFGEKTLSKEATCMDEGEISITCTLCGYQEVVEKTPKSDKHNYQNTVIRKPTCISRGEGKNVCTVCGHSVDCDYDLADHAYGDAVVTKEATCAQKGEKVYTCSVCGAVYTKEIPVKDHVWDDGACNTPATCTVCGYKSSKNRGHDYVFDFESKPSQNFAGQKLYRCTRCGNTKTTYYGQTGTYDFEAVKAVGLKRAKELGFGTAAVAPEKNPSNEKSYSSLYFMVEQQGGQKALENGVVNMVNRLYDDYMSGGADLSRYYVAITVWYSSSGSMGTGTFYVKASAYWYE
jgi:hypothetical protein